MQSNELTKREREIISQYCPKCGYRMTIGKKGRFYCIKCSSSIVKSKRKKNNRRRKK